MGVVALGSVRSCAVTTTTVALAAAWPEDGRRLVVELDPAGGTLAAQFGLKSEPALVSLAAAARRRDDHELIWEHCQQLAPGTEVLAAPPSSEQTVTACRLLGALPTQLARLDADIFVDCGRLSAASLAHDAFASADMALLLVRRQLSDLHALAAWLERRTGKTDALVLVGDGPYNKAEVEEALHIEVLGEAPFDSDGVASLAGGGSRRTRASSPLLRHMRSIAEAVQARLAANEAPSASVPDDETQSRTDIRAVTETSEREEARS